MGTKNIQCAALVMLGGGAGATTRYLIQAWWPSSQSSTNFTATLWSLAAVNLVGCILIGLIVDPQARRIRAHRTHAFWVTGVLGGFTSFSAFVALIWQLGSDSSLNDAALYVVASVVSCMLGYMAGQSGRVRLENHRQAREAAA